MSGWHRRPLSSTTIPAVVRAGYGRDREGDRKRQQRKAKSATTLGGQTGRQADRQTGRQAGRQADRQTDKQRKGKPSSSPYSVRTLLTVASIEITASIDACSVVGMRWGCVSAPVQRQQFVSRDIHPTHLRTHARACAAGTKEGLYPPCVRQRTGRVFGRDGARV